MSAIKVTTLPHECANLSCPNRPGEGRFVLVETTAPVVGGHRPFRALMCAPCANALGLIS